jgi:hypothetical protein
MNTPTAPAPVAIVSIGSTGSVAGQPPMHLTMPTTIIVRTETTNPYVGIANNVPDSRAPRRFASVTNHTNMIESATRWSLAHANADPIANTPATTDTTTVIR